MQAACVICMEPLLLRSDEAVTASKCGHVFHEACITRWLSVVMDTPVPQVCPQCRSTVDRERLVRLYFTESSTSTPTTALDRSAVDMRIAELEKQLAAKESQLKVRHEHRRPRSASATNKCTSALLNGYGAMVKRFNLSRREPADVHVDRARQMRDERRTNNEPLEAMMNQLALGLKDMGKKCANRMNSIKVIDRMFASEAQNINRLSTTCAPSGQQLSLLRTIAAHRNVPRSQHATTTANITVVITRN